MQGWLGKCSTMVKALDKLVVATDKTVVNIEEIKKADKKYSDLSSKYGEMMKWAAKFGLTSKSGAKRKRAG